MPQECRVEKPDEGGHPHHEEAYLSQNAGQRSSSRGHFARRPRRQAGLRHRCRQGRHGCGRGRRRRARAENPTVLIADDAYRAHRAFTAAKTQVDRLAAATPAAALAPVVGHTTAGAVFAEVGDARAFPSARAFLKAMGLNLKEKSSGTIHGQLKITKRGPSRVRQYLWLASFRWIQTDPIANAWYQRKKRPSTRPARALGSLWY
jgi:transposase